MALTDSLPTQDAAGLSIADWRLLNGGQIVRNAAGAVRLGVFPDHTNALVTGAAGMNYSIAPFVAAVSRTGALGTAELLANDATTSVSTTAAPGSNSRIDVIWVRPQFVSSSDGGNVPLFGVTQGTAAASPTKPSIPAGALELATAVILSTTTNTNSGVVFTQTVPYTAAAGGVVKVRNSTELAAWTPSDGGLAYQLDIASMWQRDAGAWTTGSPNWAPYTTTWGAATVAPSIGNGTLTARAQVAGPKTLRIRINLVFGSTTSGGEGTWTFTLPSSITAHGTGEQILPCKAYLGGPGLIYVGMCQIAAGSATLRPHFPLNNSVPSLGNVQNANAGGAPGTGVPLVSGQYSFLNTSNLVIEGFLEIA